MGKLTTIELAVGSVDTNLSKKAPALQPEVSIVYIPECETQEDPEDPESTKPEPYVRQIVWFNVIKIATLHIFGLSALLLVPFAHDATFYFMFFLAFLTLLGVQVGAHRLWAHRSYKANAGVRLFLCLCHTMSMQNDLYEWVRDHRVHHKWSDSDADPHNANRGFFFSHMGWLMVRKHPELIRKGATLDLSDLTDDPIIMFQRKFIFPLVVIFWALLPTFIPVFCWNEAALISFFICVLLRYLLTLHITWMVNSWAHMFGTRPYNTSLVPVEASIRHVLVGEGFHNYHHQFPWDYSASELGPYDVFNPATAIINLFSKLGWAWDLKKPHPSLIERTIANSGDRKMLYQKGIFKSIWEWTLGLATMTFPVWGLLLEKYAFLYLYYMYFDKTPNFDIPSLWNYFISFISLFK